MRYKSNNQKFRWISVCSCQSNRSNESMPLMVENALFLVRYWMFMLSKPLLASISWTKQAFIAGWHSTICPFLYTTQTLDQITAVCSSLTDIVNLFLSWTRQPAYTVLVRLLHRLFMLAHTFLFSRCFWVLSFWNSTHSCPAQGLELGHHQQG